MKATFVIIGGGIAGVSCAEQLAYLVPEEQILLISATSMVKKVTNLNRIAQIINTFDVEETDKKDLENDHTNLKVIQGHVTEIDSKKREITLKTGNRIQYHYVLLCHGARPKLVSNDKYIFGIRDTESVQKFQDNLKDARKIVIVGNGGIATEMVHELKNVEIVWIIKDSSIAATFVDPGAGQFFLEEMFKNEKEEETVPATKRSKYTAKEFKSQSNGTFGGALGPDWHSHLDVQGCLESEKKVTLETQASIETIVENAEDEFKVLVTLTNGKVIKCDLVVSATGVIPNGDTIKIDDLILDSDNAITVNDQMETNLKHVYAAGDVASCSSWKHAPLWFQMRLWTQARQFGSYAAQCVHTAWLDNGNSKDLDFCFELFTHATKFFGFKVILLGLFNGQGLDVNDYEVLLRVTKGKEYVKVILQEGRMQGAILVGETDLEETFENLILNQMDLSVYGEGLLDPTIDIEDYFD